MGSAGAQGPPGSPGKDANYCPCPDREESYGKGYSRPSSQPSYGAGQGGNYNAVNAGGGRPNYNAVPSSYTGATYRPATTRSPFPTYPPPEAPPPAPQLYPQPKDTVFGK